MDEDMQKRLEAMQQEDDDQVVVDSLVAENAAEPSAISRSLSLSLSLSLAATATTSTATATPVATATAAPVATATATPLQPGTTSTAPTAQMVEVSLEPEEGAAQHQHPEKPPKFLTVTFGEGVLGFRLLTHDANVDLEGDKYHAQVAKISGPAEASGVEDGMLVYDINDFPFRNMSALNATLHLREAARDRPLTIKFVLVPQAQQRIVSLGRSASASVAGNGPHDAASGHSGGGGGSSGSGGGGDAAPTPVHVPSRMFVPILGQPSEVAISIDVSKEFLADVVVGGSNATSPQAAQADGGAAAAAPTPTKVKTVKKTHYAVTTTITSGGKTVHCTVNRR